MIEIIDLHKQGKAIEKAVLKGLNIEHTTKEQKYEVAVHFVIELGRSLGFSDSEIVGCMISLLQETSHG